MTHQTVPIRSTRIFSRQSTDVLSIADSDVAEAVRFIREAARAPLTVDDVIATMAISRRRLDQKFCQVLGHPIHQEITRARIERISRYFQRHQGISPKEYRRRYASKA